MILRVCLLLKKNTSIWMSKIGGEIGFKNKIKLPFFCGNPCQPVANSFAECVEF